MYAICFNLDQSKILSSGNGLNSGLYAQVLVLERSVILLVELLYEGHSKSSKPFHERGSVGK